MVEDELQGYQLLKDVPLLKKGVFYFQVETGHVYWKDKGEISEYPLRTGLAGYLWLLRTEKGYFRKVSAFNKRGEG